MREEKVEIKTADGTADATVYAPDGHGPFPAVLYYPDGLGLRPAFHQMAQRLAGEGCVVLLPNIYYRTTTGPFFDFPLDFNDPKTRQRFMELTGPLTPEAMERDALTYLDFLGKRSDVNGRMGVVGYCLTGSMAMRTAAAASDRILSAASFHGGRLCTDDSNSPHLALPRIKARLLFGHAENDQSMPAETIVKLDAALKEWSGAFESETYPAKHGWCVPGGEVYNEAQAERHFAKLKSLFAETLR